MSPRRADSPTPFQEANYQVQDLMQEVSVDNEQLFTAISNLEQLGTVALGQKEIDVKRFANTMHAAYVRVVDLEVVPPVSEEQKNLLAGKVATFAAMGDIAEPKSPLKPKPTDTKKIQTRYSK